MPIVYARKRSLVLHSFNGLKPSAVGEGVRIALVPSFLYVAGGAEKLSLEMYRALRDLDYEVDLYTAYLSEGAWETLTSGMNGIPRPIVLGEPPINRLFSRTVLLRELLVISYLVRRLRPRLEGPQEEG